MENIIHKPFVGFFQIIHINEMTKIYNYKQP